MPSAQQINQDKEEKYFSHLESQDSDFYRNILNSIEDYAVFTLDLNGYINTWNEGAKNLLGYASNEILGQYVGVLFTQEDLKAEAEKKELKEASKKRRGVDERYHVRKDKSEFWSSGIVFPLFNSRGKHTGFTKVMRNISSKKVIDDQLKEVELYAKSIVQTVREPMIVLNNDLSVNTANDAFYKSFNLKKKELSAKPIFELFESQLNIQELKVLLNKITADNKAVKDYELSYDFKSAGKRTLIFNGRKIYHPALRINLILLSMEDITEKRSLEQQKDDYISIASHEIRTPITVIKALTQMLQKRSPSFNDQSVTKSLGKIDEKTDKLMSLINYLLDVTQIESGELQVVKSKFDID